MKNLRGASGFVRTRLAATGGGEGQVAGSVAQWGDYEVHFDDLLGRGGMGSVYRARQRSLGRWVAVKVLDTSNAPDPALKEGFLQKFRMEIAALSRLNDPRIVTILQAGEDDGRLWFAMELIEGRTVEERLGREGAFPEPEARRIAAEAARALDAASRAGIVHRDVKPANIFLLPDGGVKLADFGLARVSELGPTRMTESNAVACTPAYASPEQAEGGATDRRSDLYSLGCVVYEMVTERPPFSGESNLGTLFKHALKSPTLPRVLNPEISEELEALILRCLEKEPEDRYQDYPELIAALEPRRPAAPPPEPPRAWLWPAAAAAGLAILAVILTAIFTDVPAEVKAVEPPRPVPLVVAPYPGVLPYVREPRPGEFPVSPERDAVDLRTWFLDHGASPEELQSIRKGWAIVEQLEIERAASELAAQPRPSRYARLVLDAEIARLKIASEIRAAFEARLRPGSTVDLRLAGGRTAAGTVLRVDAEAVEIQAGEIVRVARREIAEESVYASEPADRQLLYRATHGNGQGALEALERRLGGPELVVEELAGLPGLIHAIALRGVAGLDGGDPSPARATLDGLKALESRLPKTLLYALECLAMLEYELQAADALLRNEVETVLVKFDRSRAYPRAAAAALAGFRKRPGVEFIAQGHREAWKFEPYETDVEIRRRHLYEDSENGAFVLDQPTGRRAMRRSVPQASRGYVLEYAFLPVEAGAQWTQVLTEDLRLVGTHQGLALVEKDGKPVSTHAFEGTGPWRSLTIVPVGTQVLVYDGARLAFQRTAARLETRLEIGLSGGALKLRSLKAASGGDE